MQPEPQPGDTIVGGMRTFRQLLILGFVVAFAGALAGVLRSAFAVALGVAKLPGQTRIGYLLALASTSFRAIRTA